MRLPEHERRVLEPPARAALDDPVTTLRRAGLEVGSINSDGLLGAVAHLHPLLNRRPG
jgi:hypothetical protein